MKYIFWFFLCVFTAAGFGASIYVMFSYLDAVMKSGLTLPAKLGCVCALPTFLFLLGSFRTCFPKEEE